jgi:hypothetical protein
MEEILQSISLQSFTKTLRVLTSRASKIQLNYLEVNPIDKVKPLSQYGVNDRVFGTNGVMESIKALLIYEAAHENAQRHRTTLLR